MKNLKCIYGFLFCMIVLSCKLKRDPLVVNRLIDRISYSVDDMQYVGDLSDTTNIFHNSASGKYTLFYYYNGDCSVCVSRLVIWLNNWQETFQIMDLEFAVVSEITDETLLSYYLSRSKFHFDSNFSMYIDKKNTIPSQNLNLVPEEFYLLDETQNVICIGDPITSVETYNKYESLDILHKKKQ